MDMEHIQRDAGEAPERDSVVESPEQHKDVTTTDRIFRQQKKGGLRGAETEGEKEKEWEDGLNSDLKPSTWRPEFTNKSFGWWSCTFLTFAFPSSTGTNLQPFWSQLPPNPEQIQFPLQFKEKTERLEHTSLPEAHTPPFTSSIFYHNSTLNLFPGLKMKSYKKR